MPGQQLPNCPSATGDIWNQLVAGGPNVTFTQDGNNIWKRGHLINGRWGGPGGQWTNLTPLTSRANSNHETVESFIDEFITNSDAYARSDHRTKWYGVYYLVQCSAISFSDAATTHVTNLYSYAPAFIKISWRAASTTKPIAQSTNHVKGILDRLTVNPAATIPFNVRARPPAMRAATLPAGNTAGGIVLGAPPHGFPRAQANGFDGHIEIHQS